MSKAVASTSSAKSVLRNFAVLALLPALIGACEDEAEDQKLGLDTGIIVESEAGAQDAAVIRDSDTIDANASVDVIAPPDSGAPDTAPSLPANALTAKQVVSGERWSLAVRPNGDLFAWGQYANADNGHYQGGGKYASRPVKV